jgi:alpha-mannosidase
MVTKISFRDLAVALALLLSASVAHAAERTVWRIGVFDHSSNEFRSQGIGYSNPKDDPVYRVGESKDAQDWQRFQPGPANGMAGGREHPFTVFFDLPDAPRGVYHLKIAMLYETPRLSHLRVDINGHAGMFYFHPRLDYNAGDWEGTFVPQTSVDTKIIAMPAAWLKKGSNRLVLTALDDPATPQNSFGAIALGHSGLVYDALEFSQDATTHYRPNVVEAMVVPSVFYRDTKAGLAEVVEVYAGFAAAPRAGDAELSLGGGTLRQSFISTDAFGEQRLEFDVPEWTGTARATLKIGAKKFPLTLTAAKKWTVLIVPQEHLDIGFTDYPEKVAELHSESIDGVMQILKRIPEFRWTLDGDWVAEKYMAARSDEKKQELIRWMKDGKIILPPQYANQHTGTASLEGLFRSLYDSHTFARQNGLQLGAAHITDVPSYSWSYASVLADAGVKYFVAASNGWRAPILLIGRWNEKSPFYWEGPDGGRVLMWYSRAYLQLGTLFATPPRVEAVQDSLPVFLQAYSHPEYKASSTIIFGTQLENTPLAKEQAELPQEWAKHYAWPRLEFSTFGDAMASIEKQFDGRIATYRGDFGPYWEDGFGSDSAATAIHRENQQRILSAEKLGTVPAVLNPDLRPERELLNRAWNNSLLFDEHTWTYVGATTQPENEQTKNQLALKHSRTTSAEREIGESIHRSWAQLESFLGPKDTSIAVFNSLNWTRSGLVTLDLQNGYGLFDSVTGKTVPVETLHIGKSTPLPGFGGGYRLVRFRAEDVPAVGYKLFAIRSEKTPAGESTKLSGATFENRYYRVTIDAEAGALRSIWDKDLNRELVDANSPYRFGAYVYVTGADDMPNNSLYRYGSSLKPPKLNPVAANQGRVVSVEQIPFGTRITLESSAPQTPTVRTEITLFDSEKRIDFAYRIHKDYVLSKEATYIAFPFAAEKPQFAYETQNGWVDPAKDELPGGSREWYTVNHWAAVRSGDWSAAILPADAPLVNFGDIVRGKWPSEFTPVSGTIFSWLMNNYWGTNFAPGQGGDFSFHYSLVSEHGFHPAELTRRGWEALTPLESDPVNATFTPGPLPSDQASLLKVDNPNVVLVTWKMAEDGDGTIVRLEEIAGQAEDAHLSSPYFGISEAWRCSGVEDSQSSVIPVDGGVQVSLRPFEIVTLRLRTHSKLAQEKTSRLEPPRESQP